MQVVKGGGLFGLFQQDTVYADGGAEDAAPPSDEVVERAITKKGSGRKSVKELIGRKGADEPAAPAEVREPAPGVQPWPLCCCLRACVSTGARRVRPPPRAGITGMVVHGG